MDIYLTVNFMYIGMNLNPNLIRPLDPRHILLNNLLHQVHIGVYKLAVFSSVHIFSLRQHSIVAMKLLF